MIDLNEEFDLFCNSQQSCGQCEFYYCETSEECKEQYKYNYKGNHIVIQKLTSIEGKLDEIIKLLKEYN